MFLYNTNVFKMHFDVWKKHSAETLPYLLYPRTREKVVFQQDFSSYYILIVIFRVHLSVSS